MRRKNDGWLVLLVMTIVLSQILFGCGRKHAIVDPSANVLIGDVNQDGDANTIADVVLLADYFVQGSSAFTVDEEKQILATDVNRNGISLELSDYQYLIRLAVGDAYPHGSLQSQEATYSYAGGYIVAHSEIGAICAVVPGEVTPELITDDFSIRYEYHDGVTRILAASIDDEPATGEILMIGQVRGEIEVELAVPSGAPTISKPAAVVDDVYLGQNYPNPFQESTTINFHLPEAAEYRLVICNVVGQPVGEYYGYAEAGVVSFEWSGVGHSPGIYFYRLEVNERSYTKKMLLL